MVHIKRMRMRIFWFVVQKYWCVFVFNINDIGAETYIIFKTIDKKNHYNFQEQPKMVKYLRYLK